MTREEFEKIVLKRNKADSILYYPTFLTFIVFGIVVLYSLVFSSTETSTRIIGCFISAALFFLGIVGIFFPPTICDVITVESKISPEKKLIIVQQLSRKFGKKLNENPASFYRIYFSSILRKDLDEAYLSFDEENFYLSIARGGFTENENLREKIVDSLNEILEQESIL